MINPGNERTYTFREVVAAAIVDAITDRIVTLKYNASAIDLHTERDIVGFKEEAAFLREALVIMGEECPHIRVEKDDDGLFSSWFWCTDCDQEVVLSEPDEDGKRVWEVAP